ncbi:class I SAM-dependent methyltransferase [Streptomyces sp. NPDC051994]|uniref:SAM-dependent methyltransferase n=1 Tax=unclassified Streptomyces TaxID=2593676 RepID=UPI003434641F
MERDLISTIAHTDHPIAGPLGDESVRRILERALPRGDGRLLDLGCAEAEWLVRALDGRPALRADGVDINETALAKARTAIDAAGLADRVRLHTVDAREFAPPQADPYDVVLCIGATHAFGGLLPTLEAARRHLAPGGSVLVGEGFLDGEVNETMREAGFASDEYPDLAGTFDQVTGAGWVPVNAHVSSQEEWDAYEFSWTGSLASWALDHPEHPDAAEALKVADEHRTGYVRGYRGVLGFVTLELRAGAAPSSRPPVT